MANGVKTILSLLQSMGGLATGAVFSLLFAITLLVSEVVPLDMTVVALAWIMVAFVYAIGFYTAMQQMKEEQAKLEVPS